MDRCQGSYYDKKGDYKPCMIRTKSIFCKKHLIDSKFMEIEEYHSNWIDDCRGTYCDDCDNEKIDYDYNRMEMGLPYKDFFPFYSECEKKVRMKEISRVKEKENG